MSARNIAALCFAAAGVVYALDRLRSLGPPTDADGASRQAAAGPRDEDQPVRARGSARSTDSSRSTDPDERAGPSDPGAHPDATEPTDAADAKRRELLDMSDSFRDTSLLVAIRRGGYTCMTLMDVAPAASGLAAWRVACEDGLAYWVGVDRHGRMGAEPAPDFDGLAPFPVPAPGKGTGSQGGSPLDDEPRRIERMPYRPPIPPPER